MKDITNWKADRGKLPTLASVLNIYTSECSPTYICIPKHTFRLSLVRLNEKGILGRFPQLLFVHGFFQSLDDQCLKTVWKILRGSMSVGSAMFVESAMFVYGVC